MSRLQVLLANVLVKIGAVFTVALPLVWLGGLLYHCTSGESLQISLFKVYAVLYRAPGMYAPVLPMTKLLCSLTPAQGSWHVPIGAAIQGYGLLFKLWNHCLLGLVLYPPHGQTCSLLFLLLLSSLNSLMRRHPLWLVTSAIQHALDSSVQEARCCAGTGAKVTEETTLPAALLMNLIFLCGLFTFAVVLGFVSEEIKSQLRSVKAGNYAGMSLPVADHNASFPVGACCNGWLSAGILVTCH